MDQIFSHKSVQEMAGGYLSESDQIKKSRITSKQLAVTLLRSRTVVVEHLPVCLLKQEYPPRLKWRSIPHFSHSSLLKEKSRAYPNAMNCEDILYNSKTSSASLVDSVIFTFPLATSCLSSFSNQSYMIMYQIDFM